MKNRFLKVINRLIELFTLITNITSLSIFDRVLVEKSLKYKQLEKGCIFTVFFLLRLFLFSEIVLFVFSMLKWVHPCIFQNISSFLTPSVKYNKLTRRYFSTVSPKLRQLFQAKSFPRYLYIIRTTIRWTEKLCIAFEKYYCDAEKSHFYQIRYHSKIPTFFYFQIYSEVQFLSPFTSKSERRIQ